MEPVAAAEIVSVVEAPGAADGGLNEQVASLGKPEQENVTALLNPEIAATEIMVEPDEPRGTVTVLDDGLMLKSDAGPAEENTLNTVEPPLPLKAVTMKKYVVFATAEKLTEDCVVPPESSLQATLVKLPGVPVQTERIVS